MWSYAQKGWSTARRSFFLLLLLFLYQYGWGFVLFNYVKSIVVPLLHRYPGGDLSDPGNRLFWLEAQFQLMKTDLIMPYVWAFALFVLVRMALTPLINAGVLYAVHSGRRPQRIAFFEGMKRFAKPFLLLYLLQALLTFAPLLWAVPHILQGVFAATGWTSLAASTLPYLTGWLIYQGLLDLAFMYIGFGIVSGGGGWSSLLLFLRRMAPVTGVALTIFFISGGIGLLSASASVWRAGFLAVVVHQSYPLVHTLFQLWGICSQYHIWSSTPSR